MAFYLRNRQTGAAMVEMALVNTLFFSIVFAVFEFSFAVFYAARLSESTRAGVRLAAVSNSVMSDLQTMTCDQLESVGFRQCDNNSCASIIEQMNKLIRVDPSNIYIRYQCAATGYTQKAGYKDASTAVYSITLKLQGVQYPLIMPGILGLGSTITMPTFESTILSEDLWSAVN